MPTMTHQEYLLLRKSIEFCLKIHSTIHSLQALRNSNVSCSIAAIAPPNHSAWDSAQELGKPKKRTHRSAQSTKEVDEKDILKKLNLNKKELRAAINKGREINQAVLYKDIKITPIRSL
jgi:hypothetical protein